MSFPSYLYKCCRCNRSYTSDDLAGRFEYQVSDGSQFPLQQTGGWCYDCDDHVPIEDLRTEELLQEISAVRESFSKKTGLFTSISSSHKHEMELLTDQLSRLEGHLRLIERRKTPAKCLMCGSGEISPTSEVGMVCYDPECGGTLEAQDEPIYRSLVFDRRIYDKDGLLIEIVEDW